jgi:hypothetical protein
MINAPVQKKYDEYLTWCVKLPEQLRDIQAQRFYDNQYPLVDIQSFAEESDFYDLKSDLGDLTVEVSMNINSFSRDAEEFFYLRELDEFIQKVDNVTSYITQTKDWENSIMKILHDTVNIEISAEVMEHDPSVILVAARQARYTGRLIDTVKTHCIEIKQICSSVVKKAGNSLLVSQQPGRFSYLTSAPIAKTSSQTPFGKPAPTELGVELQWKGDKTDLAELIWALFKSERITDTSTGKPVTQKELVSQFIALLAVDSLDVANLMKTKYGTKSKSTSYKAQDGKTFPAELQTLLSGRVLD